MQHIRPDDFIHDSEHEISVHRERAILQLIVDDYDRRREGWWGRFLLWLLRKTT